MSCSDYRGTRAFLTYARHAHGLDESQAQSVYHSARRKARPAKSDPTVEKWQEFIDDRLATLAADDRLTDAQRAHLTRFLTSVREDAPPDAVTFAALKDMELRSQKAGAAIRRQIQSVCALRGVTRDEAEERFIAYREQYRREFANLPVEERPEPPEEWVTGYRSKDMMAVSSPGDRATLYAMYRCQADPEAFAGRPEQRFASIDLETAGPEGRDGFEPANGSIIEVGIIEYDPTGAETGRYSTLIKPSAEVAAVCGTGAVEVHQITLDDVADAPEWSAIAPEVAKRLDGRVMLAQNARFENGWLSHHLNAQGEHYDQWGPVVDTMCIARQHFSSLHSHRLSEVCARVGVAYTNGHRAEHDADVAAQAFFAMRDEITRTYLADPARANATQPPKGHGQQPHKPPVGVGRRPYSPAADFLPAREYDPWGPRPEAAPAA